MDLNINTVMHDSLIKSLAKKSKKSEEYISKLWLELSEKLYQQGLDETNIRFTPYITTLIKKRLAINETSPVLKRFKTFLSEKQTQ